MVVVGSCRRRRRRWSRFRRRTGGGCRTGAAAQRQARLSPLSTEAGFASTATTQAVVQIYVDAVTHPRMVNSVEALAGVKRARNARHRESNESD